MIDLHTWTTPNGRKISILLEELGLAYRLFPVNLDAGAQFTPAFLALSPNNKIPAIVDHDVPGRPIAVFETGAILVYLAEKTGRFLAPRGRDRYAAFEWLFWSVSGLAPMLGQLSFFAAHAAGPEDIGLVRFTTEVMRLLAVLERRHLATSPYLAGAEYSIADIAAFTWIAFAFERLAPLLATHVAHTPAIDRWCALVGRRPAVVRGLDVPHTIEMPAAGLDPSLSSATHRRVPSRRAT
jgi:GST-like protein